MYQCIVSCWFLFVSCRRKGPYLDHRLMMCTNTYTRRTSHHFYFHPVLHLLLPSQVHILVIRVLDIELVDGQGSREGRVEIVSPDGTRSTVCDDGFDSNDAIVICRQLGLTGGEVCIPPYSSVFFPETYTAEDVNLRSNSLCINEGYSHNAISNHILYRISKLLFLPLPLPFPPLYHANHGYEVFVIFIYLSTLMDYLTTA